MALNRARIEVEIRELVLRGFAADDRYRIGAAVEAELARLFAEQGVGPSLAENAQVARVDAGAFRLTSGVAAEAVGAQVARSVHRGLSR